MLRLNSPLKCLHSEAHQQHTYLTLFLFKMHRNNEIKKGHELAQHMFKKAFQPFHVDSGTRYPCSQREIDFHLHGRFLRPNKGPFVSAMQATSDIVWHNKETREIPPFESAAIDRLIDAILDAEECGYGPDVMVKAFADLDVVFFDGRLRGNVSVQWASDEYFHKWQVPPGAWGFTVKPEPGEMGQCRIKLNTKTILLDLSTDTPFKTMFGTMLHEMCHAYERIRCLPQDCDPGDGHDKHFRTKIHAVHRRAYHLLGLWAIDKRESYRKDHFMSQDWSGEWIDTNDNRKGQSSKEVKSIRGESNAKVKSSKRMGSRRQTEGECVIM